MHDKFKSKFIRPAFSKSLLKTLQRRLLVRWSRLVQRKVPGNQRLDHELLRTQAESVTFKKAQKFKTWLKANRLATILYIRLRLTHTKRIFPSKLYIFSRLNSVP